MGDMIDDQSHSPALLGTSIKLVSVNEDTHFSMSESNTNQEFHFNLVNEGSDPKITLKRSDSDSDPTLRSR